VILSHLTDAACNLFHPGNTVAITPSYQNLEKASAYRTDKNNFAPSLGVNWTPSAKSGLLRTILGNSGDTALSGGFSRAYERHGMSDFTGLRRESSDCRLAGTATPRTQSHDSAAVPQRLSRSAVDVSAASGAEGDGCLPRRLNIR
jgi:hypothetical protein